MRVLRNLDLAVDIVLDEGQIILKKYDSLDFYLKKIANGNIYKFKAKQQIHLMKKQNPDLDGGAKQDYKNKNPRGKKSNSSKAEIQADYLVGSSFKSSKAVKKKKQESDSSSDNESYLDDKDDDCSDLVKMAKVMLKHKNEQAHVGISKHDIHAVSTHKTNNRPGNNILNVENLYLDSDAAMRP